MHDNFNSQRKVFFFFNRNYRLSLLLSKPSDGVHMATGYHFFLKQKWG